MQTARCVRNYAISVALAALFASPALLSAMRAIAGDADRPDIPSLVKADIGSEAAECSVYFGLVAEADRRLGRDKEVADWTRFSQEAAHLSRAMIGEERSLASIKFGVEKMKRMLGNSLENIVIAHAEYGYQCKDLMDNPQQRWNYWFTKELQIQSQLPPKDAPASR